MDKELIDSLIEVASKHNPTMILEDRNMLKTQREEKLRRQALVKKNKLEKAEKSYVESLLWYDRHKHLAWKSVREVTTKLNKINGKTNKLKELKFQSNMHTKGHGFNSFPVYFSKDGVALTVNELSALLKRIVRQLTRLDITPPEFTVPKRSNFPVIGQFTKEVIALDAKQDKLQDDMMNRIDDERANKIVNGEVDVYSNRQDATAPELKTGMRVDVLCNYSDDDDESELLMWCQGIIQQVSNGVNISKEGGGYHKKGDVSVLWDADTYQNELASVSVVSMAKRLYNKQVQGSWRIDVINI